MASKRRRWGIAAGAVALVLGTIAVAATFVWNPGVLDEIRRDPQGARAAKVMAIELPGGKRIPVNYLREGDKVFAGADGPWWRTLRGGGDVVLEIRGERLQGHAEIVDDDPDYKRDVFDRLRPTVPKWLPSWLDAKLVVITLDSPRRAGEESAGPGRGDAKAAPGEAGERAR